MNIAVSLNSILGSLLLLILIFADYVRKYNTDAFRRSIFLRLLAFTIAAVVCDFFRILLSGYSAPWAYYSLAATLNTLFTFQIAAYFHIFLFLDYSAHKDGGRTTRLSVLVWIVVVAHLAILTANVKGGFYFSVSRTDNTLHLGRLYAIRLVVSLLPAILGIGDIVFSLVSGKNKFTPATISLFFLFILFVGASTTIDIVFGITSLVWPSFTSMILYTYFFIIRQDARIDPLTKIGNRFALDEFIDKLIRQNAKESWAIVMLDMDRFKEINDKLGHSAGDTALKDMAAVITESLAPGDFAARYGGDEFIIATKNDPPSLLSRIQSSIACFNAARRREYQIQMSYGYDVFTTGSGQLMQEFFKKIDSLMYTQKKYKLNRRGGER